VEVFNQYHAIFPDMPVGMSLAEYEMHVKNGQCARLLRGECSQPCQPLDEENGYKVDFDHILPKAHGGQNSGWNLEPKCSNYNQWVKGANPDRTFQNKFHFDQEVDSTKLRLNQNTHGFQLVKTAYRELFECPPVEIQQAFSLLAWNVGTGKSIGMVVILHAINEVINAKAANSPRIQKVLWLVHQESLVRSIKDEVENEPTDYHILDQKPNVSIVERYQDWSCSIQKSDYVFACTPSLWNRENAALTDIDRGRILSSFDAIVIDECHFAIDRYIEILNQAPRALKFVMTATPMDADGTLLSEMDDGKYRSLFKLFSVYGYQSARSMGFVKEVPGWEEGLKLGRYIPVEGGDSEFVESGQVKKGDSNTLNVHNSPRSNAIIKCAIDAAQAIKEYPAHVMVRCESVVRLKSIMKSIAEEPSNYFPPNGEGWSAVGVWSGSPGIKINHKDHPWMVVKKGKKLVRTSARVLFCVDMCQFGLNNPYCAVVAYAHPNGSLIELIQRGFGRPIRIIPSLDPDKQYIVVVFRDDPIVRNNMKRAVDFILNMESTISESFLPLGFKVDNQSPINLQIASAIPLPSSIQYRINEMQGLLPNGLDKSDIEQFVGSMGDKGTPELLEQITKYVENLRSEDYKDKQFGLPQSAQPLQFVFDEQCKKEFSLLEMEQFVKSNYTEQVKILGDLHAGNPAVVSMLNEQLIQKHTQFHRPSGKFIAVQSLLGTNPNKVDDVLDRDTDTYYGRVKLSFNPLLVDAKSSKEEQQKLKAILSKNLHKSCAQAFGMPSFRHEEYAGYEAQLSSTMCSPAVRYKIINRTKALVIEELKSKMPGHYRLYVNQILQFTGGIIGG